ncbi:CpsD/CapB family tyrosine-protein kinase [Longirhabdus pacifica]|uniref:CpsD/CapB family tyrosine-protein kinase n=1 Tax=Longirhabdus pacifica TaxID=2305227 RepID=UPI001008EB08|nr:CpsD/CapB family tyrosine-protein kinase [Longirhabdus pacifica]
MAEQYRSIRTNIQFSSVDAEVETIAVTSSKPSEGKTTTAANMAVVFAQQGKKVLLVDADLRKPTVHYTFKLQNRFGLTNVLTNQISLQQGLQDAETEHLSILTSGPIPPNPAELIGSNRMTALMDSVKQQYDLIVFDTPPILAVTDAQVLSNQCDGTILVVNSGSTEVDQAKKAKELLQGVNAKILGVVLNQATAQQNEYYAYYGEGEA